MSILKILNEIAATPSRNEKEAILRREKDNELLKAVFSAAYNPFIQYYQSFIDDSFITAPTTQQHSLKHALAMLSGLSNRNVTGHDAKTFLANLANTQTTENKEVLSRIIQRDLRCGCSESTPNKVWPGIVPTFDVMLSHKDISGIKFPCYGQIKSDGARAHISLVNGKAVALSRNGKEIELHGCLDKDLALLINEGETLDGELLCYKDGKVLDRKTGNGIINRAIKGTISKEEAELIKFASWDIVDFTSTIPYSARIEELTKIYFAYKPQKIYVLPTAIIYNELEAQKFFENCVAVGQEGCILKNIDSLWVGKRTKDSGKIKEVEEADLIISSIEEGTGKNLGKLGAFVCKTSDGLLEVNVGIGFSDTQREIFFKETLIGKIVTVKYNQLIQSKTSNIVSLFLPRFVELREDKDKANSLNELN